MAPPFSRYLPMYLSAKAHRARGGETFIVAAAHQDDANEHLLRQNNSSIVLRRRVDRRRCGDDRANVTLVDVSTVVVARRHMLGHNVRVAHLLGLLLRLRHRCWSNALDRALHTFEQRGDLQSLCLLSPLLTTREPIDGVSAVRAACYFGRYRAGYSELLYRAGRLSDHANIMKRDRHPWEQHAVEGSTSFGALCGHCKAPCGSHPRCSSTRCRRRGGRWALACAVCEVGVRGLASFCCRCGPSKFCGAPDYNEIAALHSCGPRFSLSLSAPRSHVTGHGGHHASLCFSRLPL